MDPRPPSIVKSVVLAAGLLLVLGCSPEKAPTETPPEPTPSSPPGDTLQSERGEVPAVEVRPQNRVYFFDLVRGQGATEEVTVVNHQDRPLSVLEVAAEEPGPFRAELGTVEEGRLYRLEVSVEASAPTGKHERTFLLRTDSPAMPEIPIFVRAEVREVVHAEPDNVHIGRIRFDDLDQEAVSKRSVRISKHRGKGFEILETTTDVPFLNLEVVAEKPGESYVVHARIDPERAVRGEIDGYLLVRTNDPLFQEFRLPVRGEIL